MSLFTFQMSKLANVRNYKIDFRKNVQTINWLTFHAITIYFNGHFKLYPDFYFQNDLFLCTGQAII